MDPKRLSPVLVKLKHPHNITSRLAFRKWMPACLQLSLLKLTRVLEELFSSGTDICIRQNTCCFLICLCILLHIHSVWNTSYLKRSCYFSWGYLSFMFKAFHNLGDGGRKKKLKQKRYLDFWKRFRSRRDPTFTHFSVHRSLSTYYFLLVPHKRCERPWEVLKLKGQVFCSLHK